MEAVSTERLTIRRMATTDVSEFLAYQTHPANQRYQPTEPLSEARALDFLSRMAVTEVGDSGYVAFAVELKSECRMIGEVSINLLPQPQSKGELGWSFHADYHGHGYATEAAQVLLRYAFQERQLHRVTSVCDTRNVASFRLMERLGMRREGHMQQSQFIEGTWHDEYFYALLRDEWLS